MNSTAPSGCTNPTLGSLIPSMLSGRLVEEGRQSDIDALAAHSRNCESCWNAMVDGCHDLAVEPLLRQLAEQRGMTVEEFRVHLAELVEQEL